MKKTILHTINKSPFDSPCLQQCLSVWQEGDGILLVENGVYAALTSQTLAKQLNNKTCYLLHNDAEARGLSQAELIPIARAISYDQFVQLCTEYDLVQSWY
jgi:tRNA 2-thiouridine synthesizing protein B